MIPPSLRTILCLLLLLSPVVSVQSQSTVDKAPTSTVSGKVTLGGKAVSGVAVGLLISTIDSRILRPTGFNATTDVEGNYRITNVPPGTYDVRAASPAFVATEGRTSIVVGKNETLDNVDIAIERGGVITGIVTDADGNPVVEEPVFVTAATKGGRPFDNPNLRTDDRGVYRAYGIPAGRYTVSAGRLGESSPGGPDSKSGRRRTFHPSTLDPNEARVIKVSDGTEVTNVDIVFGAPPRTYTARGRVVDNETNQPMPRISIGFQYFLPNGTSVPVTGIESTKDGEFILENLRPGKYAVFAEPSADSDWLSAPVEFEVTDQDVEGLVVRNSRGASVSGVIIVEETNTSGRPNQFGGRISARMVDRNVGQSVVTTINSNGSFRLLGLAPGRLDFALHTDKPFWLLRLERDGIIYPRLVEIKEREQITNLQIIVSPANEAIRGVIRLPRGVELPAAAKIRVRVKRLEDLNPDDRALGVEADERGHFRIDRLIQGTYELTAQVSINTPTAQPIRVSPAKQTVVVLKGSEPEVNITLPLARPSRQRP